MTLKTKIDVPEAELKWAKEALESVGGFRIVELEIEESRFGFTLTLSARLFYQPVRVQQSHPRCDLITDKPVDWTRHLDSVVSALQHAEIPTTLAGHRHLTEDEAVYRTIDRALNAARFDTGPEICAVNTLAFEYAVACTIGKKPNLRVDWFKIPKTDYICNADAALMAFVTEVEQWQNIASLQISADELRSASKQTGKQP